ncbi:MAG: hypothetical protein Q9213_005523 [Squamulea squamosa]
MQDVVKDWEGGEGGVDVDQSVEGKKANADLPTGSTQLLGTQSAIWGLSQQSLKHATATHLLQSSHTPFTTNQSDINQSHPTQHGTAQNLHQDCQIIASASFIDKEGLGLLVSAPSTARQSKPFTTAHDESQTSVPFTKTVMNDVSVADPKLAELHRQPSDALQDQILPDVATTTSTESHPPFQGHTIASNSAAVGSNNVNPIDRSDSEAETVVLDGKQEATRESTGKAIQNEDKSDSIGSHQPTINGFHTVSDTDRGNGNGSNRPSLKRKRNSQEQAPHENAPSSNLSSTVSPSEARAHSPHRSNSLSDNSRSTPALDEVAEHQHLQPRKRKLARITNDQDRKKRGKSDPNSVPVHRKELHRKGRRETRSANHHEIARHRSESLPRRYKRALSAQSTDLLEKSKRKKAPPLLVVDRQRRGSDDIHGDSDDSSSVHSHPHLHKIASAELSVMSPAKLTSKRNRDRNGRTLLARACALDLEEAKKWLKERPQDIDVPDNAGNTPLQIASLEGLADVVQLLLDARCDTTCKNIDMDTPLIDAVENGHLEVVRLLLNAGLDPRQSNAKGEEPLDLVNADNDDYDEIRAALIAAKESNTLRRPSEDQSAHNRDNDLSSLGASAASPTDGQAGRSPPSMAPGARRRTARSQQTQDRLLWVNPTPEKLREACGKGDLSVVEYILKMRTEVGADAVIAAARGGHDVVLNILFAIGQPEHDPDPLESDDFKPGRNTPMLASIGRGHISVIKLLVGQRGFNPTRRIFRGLTYYELAKERQGSNWEEEYAILKEAYDDFKLNGGRRSNHTSPRKVRTKKPEGRRSTSDLSPSPSSADKQQSSLAGVRTAPEIEIKREHSLKTPSNRHLRLPEEVKDSAILSDRDSDANGRSEPKAKAVRSVSDAGVISKSADATKPKRKLLSRNDLKSDQDTKRRASHGPDTTTHEQQRRPSDSLNTSVQGKKKREMGEAPIPVPKVRKESSKDLHSSRAEPSKKRPRLSTNSQLLGAGEDEATGIPEIKKKRKVDPKGNAVLQDPQRSDSLVRAGPAMVANMIASPESVVSPSEPPGKAPVANMGVSSASPIAKSPTSQSDMASPMSGIESTLQQNARQEFVNEQFREDTPTLSRSDHGFQEQVKATNAANDQRAAESEREKQAQRAQKEEERAARIAQEEYQALLERQRQSDEAERQARIEKQEEEIRAAMRRQAEEEEEETARRRAEQDRLRQEEQERRNAELEEREQRRRIRLQEQEQQKLRDALPNSLRRAAELSPEKARQPREIKKWLPLYTVTTREIDSGCDDSGADERWIANVQAAPILAIRDLGLSQCEHSISPGQVPDARYIGCALADNGIKDTAWERKELSKAQQQSLWRQVRNQMSQANINPLTLTMDDVQRLDKETYPKFQALKSLFWIKLSDFMDIVPRHPHLTGILLRKRAMLLHDNPWGKENGNGAPSTNGGMVNGSR